MPPSAPAGHAAALLGSTWYIVGGGNNAAGCADMYSLDLSPLGKGARLALPGWLAVSLAGSLPRCFALLCVLCAASASGLRLLPHAACRGRSCGAPRDGQAPARSQGQCGQTRRCGAVRLVQGRCSGRWWETRLWTPPLPARA